jgi:hypothetical protein
LGCWRAPSASHSSGHPERPHLLKRQMLFLFGQRAAKIALHDSQDRALLVGQTQPLGFGDATTSAQTRFSVASP